MGGFLGTACGSYTRAGDTYIEILGKGGFWKIVARDTSIHILITGAFPSTKQAHLFENCGRKVKKDVKKLNRLILKNCFLFAGSLCTLFVCRSGVLKVTEHSHL